MFVSLHYYTEALLKKFGMESAKPVKTPYMSIRLVKAIETV